MATPKGKTNDEWLETDILIIGAGMAGLTAGVELRRTGLDVQVIDKGRGVGGRLASRRIADATFDHGAQFFTARDPRFAAAVDGWIEAGVVEEWWRDSRASPEGHSRWRGSPSMTAVAKHLARDLDVLLGKRALSLHLEGETWAARLEDGETIAAPAVLITAPVPQSLELLAAAGAELPAETRALLESIEYEPCIAVLAALDGPVRLPPPGGLHPTESPIAWIADNQMKGVSATPAVTIHAAPEFSALNWDRDRQSCGQELLDAAGEWLGANVTEFQVHGWLYSKPVDGQEDPCLILRESPPLVIAGDAFGGPRVEGAALSGWAAAGVLTEMCRQSG